MLALKLTEVFPVTVHSPVTVGLTKVPVTYDNNQVVYVTDEGNPALALKRESKVALLVTKAVLTSLKVESAAANASG